MKEITISLSVRIPLTQTDVHWLEAELLAQRTQLFQAALRRVPRSCPGPAVRPVAGAS